jgi:hypothetical protein
VFCKGGAEDISSRRRLCSADLPDFSSANLYAVCSVQLTFPPGWDNFLPEICACNNQIFRWVLSGEAGMDPFELIFFVAKPALL